MSDPINIEEYAKLGKPVPTTGPYKIRVNKDFFEWPDPTITGKAVLDLAGKKDQYDRFGAYEFVRGKPVRMQLNDPVDLTQPGVERFETLPLDQTEG